MIRQIWTTVLRGVCPATGAARSGLGAKSDAHLRKAPANPAPGGGKINHAHAYMSYAKVVRSKGRHEAPSLNLAG
ncbi:MAG: hypothetical protein ACK4SS_05140 [Cypionkella sp.]